jgi:hypothetical protein
MDFMNNYKEIIDNGGTRSGRDRRKFKIMNHNPERRTGQERRNNLDRRRDQISRGKLAIERREKFRGLRLHNEQI